MNELQNGDVDKVMAALEVLARLAWSDDEVGIILLNVLSLQNQRPAAEFCLPTCLPRLEVLIYRR